MSGEVLAVASGKGGVGKTVTSVNAAVGLRLRGRSVAVVDGDVAMPNVAAHVGVRREPTLHDVLAGEASVSAAVADVAEGFGVVPGDDDIEGFASADPARVAYVVDRLARRYDHVVVDTGGGLSYENALPLQVADDVLLVTSPDPPAVDDTRRTRALLDVIDCDPRGLVVTKTTEETDAAAVADELDVALLGTVPYDTAVEESVQAGEPLQLHAPESPAADAYRRLGAALVEDGTARRRDGATV